MILYVTFCDTGHSVGAEGSSRNILSQRSAIASQEKPFRTRRLAARPFFARSSLSESSFNIAVAYPSTFSGLTRMPVSDADRADVAGSTARWRNRGLGR